MGSRRLESQDKEDQVTPSQRTILSNIGAGATPIDLSYSTGYSLSTIRRALTQLEEQGFVSAGQYVDGNRHYTLTDQGLASV